MWSNNTQDKKLVNGYEQQELSSISDDKTNTDDFMPSQRFNFFKNLPPERVIGVALFQPLRERLATDLLISKYFHDNVKNPLSWMYMGSIDYDDFVERARALPYELQKLVLSETKPYTLAFAEKANRILALPQNERIKTLLTPEQITLCGSQLSCFRYNNLILALLEGLITPKTISHTYYPILSIVFENNNGILALREGLFTLKQVSNLPFPAFIEALLNSQGISALRKGFDITGFYNFNGSYHEFQNRIERFLSGQSEKEVETRILEKKRLSCCVFL